MDNDHVKINVSLFYEVISNLFFSFDGDTISFSAFN